MSRRKMLKGIGIAGAAIAVSPAVLAACGDDSGSSAATTGGGGGAATTGAGGAATTGAGGAAEGAGATLAKLLEIDPATAGAGMEFKMGAVLALTGTGSFYGKTMTRGLDLAAKHIEAAGGPKINVIYLDHKSGDAAAGKAGHHRARREEACPAKFASYVDDLGAMLDGTAQYKIFTLDGGGGTSIFGQGKPYFWGTRAITPNDPLPGPVQVDEGDATRTPRPSGSSGWDIGEPNNSTIKDDILEEDRRRRLRVQRPLRARARRQPGLLAGAPEDQGQRARHPAASASTARTPARSPTRRPPPASRRPHRLRVHARRRERVEGHVRQGRLHVRLRLLRRRQPEEPAGQAVRRGVQEGVRRGLPTSTPPTSTRTRS